jgi:tRNA1Val (adenine37-N6)-methyltransferase
MKVGTDGVLLGAWASHPNPLRILDIGCGTGLITLMMAQRFPGARMVGVDIERGAIRDAEYNVEQSKWKDRIQLVHENFFELKDEETFDLIISNPPFFPADTPSPKEKRALARSGNDFNLGECLVESKKRLASDGRIAIILPITQQAILEQYMEENALYLSRICFVKPTLVKPMHRVMVELQTTKSDNCREETLVIETDKRHHYSDAYKELTRSFYLKMD